MKNNESQIVTELASLALSEILGIPVCLVDATSTKKNEKMNKNNNNLNNINNTRKEKSNHKIDLTKHPKEEKVNSVNTCDKHITNEKKICTCEKKPMSRKDKKTFNIAHAPIDHILYKDPATIVFWKDGTKTVVRCDEYDKYDAQAGLAIAICKKVMGNQAMHDIFEHFLPTEISNPTNAEKNKVTEKTTKPTDSNK